MFDEELISAVGQLNEDKVLKISKKHLQSGKKPEYIFEQLQIGMIKVGINYEKGDYFIADLIMAGKIFEEVLKLIQVNYKNNNKRICKIVIGTAQGDLHDIGKTIFSNMARANGFKIYDIGVDVSPASFVEKIKEVNPQIVAISGLLTLTIESMKKTIDLLVEENLRDHLKILIGGNHVNIYIANYIKADAAATTIEDGIKICTNWASDNKKLSLIS